MQVAIMADLHDNIVNWRKINNLLKQNKINQLIIAGDICTVKTLDKIAKEYIGDLYIIFGNMDTDIESMKMLASKYAQIKEYDFHAQIKIDDKTFYVSHQIEEVMALSEKDDNYKILCYGHTHEIKELRQDNYLLINPGSAGGVFSTPSLAVYDTKQDQVKFYNL
ncbi:MAG: YfcE family phosphodiesterase [Patescibacteria group bacterium]